MLQVCLFQNTLEGAGCQVVGRLAGDGDTTRLARVLELSMTAATSDLHPSVVPQHSQHRSDFHPARVRARCRRPEHATKAERDNWMLNGSGLGIHGPDIDEDISVEALVALLNRSSTVRRDLTPQTESVCIRRKSAVTRCV